MARKELTRKQAKERLAEARRTLDVALAQAGDVPADCRYTTPEGVRSQAWDIYLPVILHLEHFLNFGTKYRTAP